MTTINETIASRLNVKSSQIDAAVKLLDDGATVPFIARYRKEVTGHLTDTHLRQLETELAYLRELDARKLTILDAIKKQEKLTPALETAIKAASTKTQLEDLYLPYKPKRRTKALIAIEAGLEPLAKALLETPDTNPEEHAATFVNIEKGIDTVEKALNGARDILIEQFAENAPMLHALREFLWDNAKLTAKVLNASEDKGKKFADYYDFNQAIKAIPSHRALALYRGRKESILSLSLVVTDETACFSMIAKHHQLHYAHPSNLFMNKTLERAFKVKIFPKLELELFARLREQAEDKAIDVFADNLKNLLLLPRAGHHVTMGLDPGIRTGVKVVVLDGTGKLLDYTTVYPFAPQNQWHEAIGELAKLATKHMVELIAIGNGTGARETDRLCQDMLKVYQDLNIRKTTISEAGASVYSASELAAKEFPDLDVSLRGAVSIGRRLQDPLAELVKIDPKSIGVGQYQHDVNQVKLSRRLDGVVQDCVNAVGVDVNSASPTLLKYVAGFNDTLAKNLVKYRDENGAFTTRVTLKTIERMGEKSFEQAAGFLRIHNADNPLDNSAVHPEAYDLVENIASDLKTDVKTLIGDLQTLKAINAENYVSDKYGLPTIHDILQELEKPGRDPRPDFKTVQFKQGVETIKDLAVDMVLEGVVSNVTNFGAFVNIGVHQDGLVHISEMKRSYISDPRKIVKTGDILKVRVLELDLDRKRINLSMKLTKEPTRSSKPNKKVITKKKPVSTKTPKKPAHKKVINTAMADALAKLKEQ